MPFLLDLELKWFLERIDWVLLNVFRYIQVINVPRQTQISAEFLAPFTFPGFLLKVAAQQRLSALLL